MAAQKGAKPKTDHKPISKAEQRRRFIEAAREAGCSEDEAEFDANLSKIVKPKSKAGS